MKGPEGVLSHISQVMGTCLHCGMCLPACPTYELTGDERSSPRGRIRLIRSVMDGSLEPGRGFADEMNFCLDCRACETACPAGVRYGGLVEHARTIVTDRKLDPPGVRLKKFLVLKVVFRSRRTFTIFVGLLRLYRRSGVKHALERSGLLDLLPAGFRALMKGLPEVTDPPSPGMGDEPPVGATPSGPRAGQPGGGRVGLLTGCVMNCSFPDVHRDTEELLRMSGTGVVVPEGQFCCGSLHGHNGDPAHARKLAADLMKLFPADLDAVVVNSAGCGSFMKQYGELFRGHDAPAAGAREFAAKVLDVSEFLHGRSPGTPGPLPRARVTYHDACHLLHGQGISGQPRSLLASIPGIEFVELPDSAGCCGSAGIYNILRPDDSAKFLRRKISCILSTGADVVATGNPGCHLQIARGLRQAGSDIRVAHPVTLLREAFTATGT